MSVVMSEYHYRDTGAKLYANFNRLNYFFMKRLLFLWNEIESYWEWKHRWDNREYKNLKWNLWSKEF